MRTGIYAYTTTTLTIQAAESFDLVPFNTSMPAYRNVTGTVSLGVPAGIYKAITINPITVSGSNIDVVTVADTKDPWPDPPALVVTTFNVTQSSVDSFFTITDSKSMAL